MENDDLSQLEELLSADVNEGSNKAVQLSEVDIFSTNICDDNADVVENQVKSSAVHNGDTDSSDDEEKRNYTERKYNDYGSHIKKVLDDQENEQADKRLNFETRLRETNSDIKSVSKSTKFTTKPVELQDLKNTLCAPDYKKKSAGDVYTDPIFAIRIISPLISSTALLDRMQGRETINMSRIKGHLEHGDLSKDWVIGGVIVRKSSSQKSQKGNQFMIWTLSDLKNDLKTVAVFLFRKAYSELWKTKEGTVVAILNPNVLDKSESSKDQGCLSLDNPDRCMILGQSKDLGCCKSKKKNGDPCTAFVNKNDGEHCIYHIKQEYQKFSRRHELQSSTMGKGLVNIQKKVLGKNTVIYGGKSYSAISSDKSKKQDQHRLMSLSNYFKEEGERLMTNQAPNGAGCMKNNSGILHGSAITKASDKELLNKLSRPAPTTRPSLAQTVANSPKLGGPSGFGILGNGTIDLNVNYGSIATERAKANAINIIKQKGGLIKADPNNTKGTEVGKKRALEKLNISGNENNPKKAKTNETEKISKPFMSDRFKKLLETTSAHQNLIEQHDDEEQNKYFSKLEKKEAMEEKMLNTFKLACKAVRCTKCKYTALSASQKCKDERHPLKVLDSFKRFFKCGNCGNRTVSLDIIPLISCSSCKSSKWEKAPMMREKNTQMSNGLSIRGEEETFVGGQVTTGKNINLLVPIE